MFNKRTNWSDEAAGELLHILPLQDNHGEAFIYGHPRALERLGRALIEAAKDGKEVILGDVMPTDGEGYHVIICPRDQVQMDSVPLPYAQIGMPWDFNPT